MRVLSYRDCLGLDPIDKKCHVSAQDINPSTGRAFAERPDGIWDDNYFAQNFGGASGGGGSGGPDLSGVPSVQSFVQGQFAQEDPALNSLVMAMRSRQTPQDIFTSAEATAGLPELRKASSSLSSEIFNLEDFLKTIEPDVTARTRESLVTEAQRRGIVAKNREAPLERLGQFSTNLGRIQGGISSAEQSVSNKVNLTLQGQEQALEPLKLQFTTLVDRNSRLLSGFTADRQTELDSIYAKWNRTNTLSDMEWNRANELADQEGSYMKTLQTAAANAGITLKGGESSDSLLSMIGKTAAEQIAYNRKQAGKASETTTAKNQIKMRLQNDSASGAYSFKDINVMYADTGLTDSEIRTIYNSKAQHKAESEGGNDPAGVTRYVFENTNFATPKSAVGSSSDYEKFQEWLNKP